MFSVCKYVGILLAFIFVSACGGTTGTEFDSRAPTYSSNASNNIQQATAIESVNSSPADKAVEETVTPLPIAAPYSSDVDQGGSISALAANSTTLTIEENRAGFCRVDGTVESMRTGFTGTGYANTVNNVDASIDWQITVPASGGYTISWRFGNGSSVNRFADLYIDGNLAVSEINFVGVLNAWTTWKTVSTIVNLAAGTHDLRLQATTTDGLANLDHIQINGNNPQPGNCEKTQPTPKPTPEPTAIPQTTLVLQENALGFCGVDGTVDSMRTGFTGTGYANSANSATAGIDWQIMVPANGSYTLSWRFANGSSLNRLADLSVDGIPVVTDIDFFGVHNAWTTWITSTTEVYLSAGSHQLRLEATTIEGLANVDNMSVTGVNPQPHACVEIVAPPVATPTPAPPRPTPTPTPTPTPYPQATLTIEENTTGFCGFDGNVESMRTGFSGTGYVNTPNQAEVGINWQIHVPVSGTYTFNWRYGNGAAGNRLADLIVDGDTVVTDIDFLGVHNAWTTWKMATAEVSLAAGTHNLRLQAATAEGLANLDNLQVTGASPKPESCGEIVTSPTPPTPAKTSIQISWDIPDKRENGEDLPLSDIGGYELIYRQTGDLVFSTVTVNDPTTATIVLDNLEPSQYEILIAVFDVSGLYSDFSEPQLINLAN